VRACGGSFVAYRNEATLGTQAMIMHNTSNNMPGAPSCQCTKRGSFVQYINTAFLKIAPVCAAVVGALTIAANANAATIVTDWNEQALPAIRVTHPGPPIVARALAVANTCMFDAWAACDKRSKSTQLGKALRCPESEHTNANKTEAISYAAYRAG
jgi:hypothetical protein